MNKRSKYPLVFLAIVFVWLSNGKHTWWIQAWNSAGYGPWSTSLSFTSIQSVTYYVSPSGDDANPGTQTSPWQTIQKAVESANAGDTVYIRGGEYDTIFGGWSFQNSGNPSQPITLSNFPGEQVVIKISQSNHDYMAFRCWAATTDPQDWQTPKADFVRIIGIDVNPQTLSNGILSQKGIVIQGVYGEQGAGVEAAGCDSWEISGIDFVEVAYGVFAKKRNFQTLQDNSADSWYVHGNRVYNYYRESGMQFNGDNNIIEDNEIYKVSNELYTPYGCQLLNILGHGNVIRRNVLSRLESNAACGGILFEWDLADNNLIEQNQISDVVWGIEFAGGDNNVVRNNVVYSSGDPAGIKIASYDNRVDWPCNETTDDTSSLPANDPLAGDYKYYYAPRNCHSFGNEIYNNTIHGFSNSIQFYALVTENIVVRNNVFSGWNLADICYYTVSEKTCISLPETLIFDHNALQEPFGFVDLSQYDFHLLASSPLIDAGYDLGTLNPNDFDDMARPHGEGYDIGAYELPAP